MTSIHNGVLSNGTAGINATGAAATLIQKLDLEDLKIQDSTGDAIHLEFVEGAVIRRVEITDANAQAIDWGSGGGGPIKHGTIEHNLMRRGGAMGSSSTAAPASRS